MIVFSQARCQARCQARSICAAAMVLGLACVLLSSGCDRSPSGDFASQVLPFGKDHYVGEDSTDFCVPLEDPVWKDSFQALRFMRPDDPVVGITTNKGAYAIPWWVLKNHHVANFDVDGEEILVTLCEACSSAAAFDPRVDGERLHYRIVGMYNGTHILRDRETQTFWLPFLGTGMDGPHRGKQLKRRRVDQAVWTDWLALHPKTFVAFAEESARSGHGSRHSPGTPLPAKRMEKTLQRRDSRVPQNDLVLGVMVGGAERAYPMKELTKNGSVLQEKLGDQSVVIFHKPDTFLAAAFSRIVNGDLLDFKLNEKSEIVDQQTGSIWSYAGVAQSGPLAGTQLDAVTYILEEWFMWATQHEQATIYLVLQGF